MNNLTGEQRLALIEVAEQSMRLIRAEMDVYPSKKKAMEKQLKLMEIALAALTAEPDYYVQEDIWENGKGRALSVNIDNEFAFGKKGFPVYKTPPANSPVIPDGSADTKRLDWLDAENKRLNAYHGTTYGWKYDGNFQHRYAMLSDAHYPPLSIREAIDRAMLAAAPSTSSEDK